MHQGTINGQKNNKIAAKRVKIELISADFRKKSTYDDDRTSWGNFLDYLMDFW